MTTTTALSIPTDTPDLRVRRAADAAVERIVGDRASPELKKAAASVVAPWASKLVSALDDWMLDPIIGFIVPGAGDAITGTGSVALLFLALKERVPTIVLLRMCLNILVDTVGGLVPFAGDAFDLVWRSNRRNLNLIERHAGDSGEKPTWLDYVLVMGGVLLAIASVVIPIFIVYGLGATLLYSLFG